MSNYIKRILVKKSDENGKQIQSASELIQGDWIKELCEQAETALE